MNSVGSGSSLMQAMTQYPSLGQVPVAHPYEPSQAGKELNKYASLKAVGKRPFLNLPVYGFDQSLFSSEKQTLSHF